MKTIKVFFVSLTIIAGAISSYQGIALAAKVAGTDMQYVSQGVNLAVQGKFNEAKEKFEKALKIEPSNDTTKRALKIIENFDDKKIESKTSIFLFKGLAFFMNGSWDQAIMEYNKAIEINPKLSSAYNNRAIAYYSKKEYDKAWDDVNQAQSLGSKIHPGFLKALREASGRQQ